MKLGDEPRIEIPEPHCTRCCPNTVQAPQYRVLVGDADDLARDVNAALAEGWELQGGVGVSVYTYHDEHNIENTGETYAQAIVKWAP